MNSSGIKFHPLYWIYHDCWINRTWGWDWYHGWNVSNTSRHMGHLHFFMPDYDIKDTSLTGKAYSGKQIYSFSLKSIWGPGSNNINQSNDVEYVGSPKWYFEINEYWRRVYIQPWDDKLMNEQKHGIVGRVGIKYDASHKNHTYGPFREGRNFFFYWNKSARTLPIEYYLDEKKRTRNNYLYGANTWYLPININYDEDNSDSVSLYMKRYTAVKTPFFIPNGDNNGGYVDRPLCYRINWTTSDTSIDRERFNKWWNIAVEIGATHCGTDERGTNIIKYCDYGYHDHVDCSNSLSISSSLYKIPFGAFNVTCADHRYIYPIIEYQRVKHLDFERLPGWSQRDRDKGGDGFEINVELPYTVNDKVQSPFSDDSGKVSPMGVYHHNFDTEFPDMIPKFQYCDKVDIGNYQWIIVNKNDDGYGNITETYVRTVIGNKPKEEDLDDGESIASQQPYPNGYVQDNKGRPIYAKRYNINTEEYRIPNEWKDKVMTFHVPTGMKKDGVWVEQCFGGVVRAKAVVTIKDNFGAVRDVEVTTTRFYIADQFEGSDQNAAN